MLANQDLWPSYDKLEGMPKFSIKDLLISTLLISLGAAMLSVMIRQEYFSRIDREPIFFLMWFSVGPLLGAGVLKLFHHAWLGACLGLAVELLMIGFAVTVRLS